MAVNAGVPAMSVRTAVFVDGLNLYHGMREEGWRRARWLDVEALADALAADAGGALGKSLDVQRITYCTTSVS